MASCERIDQIVPASVTRTPAVRHVTIRLPRSAVVDTLGRDGRPVTLGAPNDCSTTVGVGQPTSLRWRLPDGSSGSEYGDMPLRVAMDSCDPPVRFIVRSLVPE